MLGGRGMLEVVASDGVRLDSGSESGGPEQAVAAAARTRREQHESHLVDQLRKEAVYTTDEFTKYALRALGVASVAFAAVVEFMFSAPFSIPPHGEPFLGFAAVPVLIFILLTMRLGTYSFTTSNRLFGYQLYLARVCNVPEGFRGRWRDEYRDIGWEEAIRAWRIAQHTLFRRVFRRPSAFLPHRYAKGFKPSRANPKWFKQESLFGPKGVAGWYGDSQLRTMQWLLLLAAAIAAIIMCITPFALDTEVPSGLSPLTERILKDPISRHYAISLAAAFAGFSIAAVVVSYINERSRRILLRDELLSIHSCAIVWQAVVLAHWNAVHRSRACGRTSWELATLANQRYSRRTFKRVTRNQWQDWRKGDIPFEKILEIEFGQAKATLTPDGSGLTGYTFWLGQEANSLARWANDVPGWVGHGGPDYSSPPPWA